MENLLLPSTKQVFHFLLFIAFACEIMKKQALQYVTSFQQILTRK